MKKTIGILLAFLLLNLAMAQAPNAFNYQVVVRNNTGQAMANQSVGFRFTIHDGSGGGTILYRETQSITTNSLGLAVAMVGKGTVVTGAWPTAVQFSSGDKYFQVEMDPAGGSAYTDMGATQMLSVPMANYANNAGTANNANNFSGTVNPSQIGAAGANSGELLKWNGSSWVPSAQLTAGTGVTIASGKINTPWTANGNDIANNNSASVGIGTASPLFKLDVYSATSGTTIRAKSGTTSGTGNLIAENSDGLPFSLGKGGSATGSSIWGWSTSNAAIINNTSGGAMFLATGDSLGFLIGGNEAARFTSTGNFGIGEKNPLYKFQVTHGGTLGMKVKSTSSYSVIDIDAFTGDAALRFADNGVNQWNLRNQPGTDNLQIFEIGLGERFLIQNSTGNIGIGQSSPLAKLHVNSPSTTKSAAIFEGSGSNNYDSALVSSYTTYSGSNNMYHFTAISSTVNRGIGYESRTKWVGVEALVQNGTLGAYGGYFFAGNPSVVNYGVYAAAGGSNGTNYGLFATSYSGSTNLSIYCSGNGVYTGTWSSSSDARLKKGIENLNKGLDVVMQLRPTSYEYRTDETKFKSMCLPSGTHFGFIAQELESVLPTLVSNNIHKPGTGSSGTETETIDFKAVNYTELIPVLTKAIQEQQAQIEALKLEVKKLQEGR